MERPHIQTRKRKIILMCFFCCFLNWKCLKFGNFSIEKFKWWIVHKKNHKIYEFFIWKSVNQKKLLYMLNSTNKEEISRSQITKNIDISESNNLASIVVFRFVLNILLVTNVVLWNLCVFFLSLLFIWNIKQGYQVERSHSLRAIVD